MCTPAANQLQDTALAKPSSGKKTTKQTLKKSMNLVFSELSMQGTECQPVWPGSDWFEERTKTSVCQPLPLPGDSGGGQGLSANDQDPQGWPGLL